MLLLSFCAAAPAAENLSSVRTGTLPALEAGASVLGIASTDARLLAITADGAWLLDADAQRWSRASWKPDATLVAIAGDGHRVLALAGEGGAIDRVESLTLDGAALGAHPLPPLPVALARAHAAVLGDTLDVAGVDASGASHLLQLALAAESPQWTTQPGWPGDGAPSSIVAQANAVLVTIAREDGSERLLRWSAERGWNEEPAVPGRVIEGSARAIGQAHALYLLAGSGAGGKSRLMAFHTITESWATLGTTDASGANFAAPWKNGIAWAKPGANGAELGFAEIESGKLLLKWLDWIVIVVYLATMVGMGLYFYLREKRNSTSDFFVGGRTIPFWAAGISLYAANTSSISFIAIPAKAFETNWQYLTNNLIAVLGLMFVGAYIVPLLRRLDLMSVFSYLETRFHPAIRMLASALCIAMQIG
ncbi:MAG TPA: sodium:solute symporter, partial [Rhodanobacteraceae bacterium]|nr:sodium:solute symporter [Rhodanobacteraceae bacterium]